MIEVTDRALLQVKKLKEEYQASDDVGIRVNAHKNMDGEVQYGIRFDLPSENDLTFGDDYAKIFISQNSYQYLKDAVIDVEEAHGASAFKINIPQEPDPHSGCSGCSGGCGSDSGCCS